MRLLDLFCAGGGASTGFDRAGFEVVGIDLDDQSRYYPFAFHQGDATTVDPEWMAGFDLIWASPPCQRYTVGAARHGTSLNHPDLIPATRVLLQSTGKPWIIENVPQAPLRADLLLCGKMFDLPLIRHRIFEMEGFQVEAPEHPSHSGEMFTVVGHPGGKSTRDGTRGFGSTADWRRAMGIEWLPARLMAEAIPPAYTEHIGRAFMDAHAEQV